MIKKNEWIDPLILAEQHTKRNKTALKVPATQGFRVSAFGESEIVQLGPGDEVGVSSATEFSDAYKKGDTKCPHCDRVDWHNCAESHTNCPLKMERLYDLTRPSAPSPDAIDWTNPRYGLSKPSPRPEPPLQTLACTYCKSIPCLDTCKRPRFTKPRRKRAARREGSK